MEMTGFADEFMRFYFGTKKDVLADSRMKCNFD